MSKKRFIGIFIVFLMMAAAFGSYAWADSTYTVKAGDSLWKIGEKHGVDWVKIAELNSLKDVDIILEGQQLKIPDATEKASKTVEKEVANEPDSVEEYTTKDLNEQLVMATLWMQQSAEFRALCYQAFNTAKMTLNNDLTNNTTDKPRAIVVDADETLIDNSAYEAHLVGQDYGYSSSTWNQWMNAAEAKALPGALEFLTYANEKGVEVFYITNRKMVGYEGTEKNLKALGFPNVDEKHMLLRTTSSDKEERRQTVKKDYHIVLYMGDNLNDFSSDFGGKSIKERFTATDENQDKFGTEWIVLPNPTYGEWEGAVYDYNWGTSAKEKDDIRKQKLTKWNKSN